MATDMQNIKVSEGSSATKENNPAVYSVTPEYYALVPPKPMGTRPCSPSESDVSAYALPPPAYHASLDVQPAIPAPTTTAAPTESAPAQNTLPVPAPSAISAPALAIIASIPAALQSLSVGTPAQPATACAQVHIEVFDVESMENRRRRRHYLVDNAAVRGVRRAGRAPVWFAQDLHRRRPWIIKCLATVLLTDSVVFLVLLIVARAT